VVVTGRIVVVTGRIVVVTGRIVVVWSELVVELNLDAELVVSGGRGMPRERLM